MKLGFCTFHIWHLGDREYEEAVFCIETLLFQRFQIDIFQKYQNTALKSPHAVSQVANLKGIESQLSLEKSIKTFFKFT